jgi:hypothetical protein
LFRRPRHQVAAGLAAVIVGVPLAHGGSLELVPTVQAGGVYETNPRFKADCSGTIQTGCGPDYVTGTFVDANLSASWKTPATELNLTPRVRDWNFLGSNKDLNNNDLYINGFASQRFQRLNTALFANYSDTLIRQFLFESATPTDPNAPPPPIGNSVQTANDGATEQRWLLRPNLRYQLSTRNELGLEVQYSDVQFDNRANAGFFDFDATTANLSLTHSLNPRNSLQLAINGSTFDADNFARAEPLQRFANSTDSYGLSFIYERVLSETLSTTIQLGTARNTVTVQTPTQGRFRSTDSTLVGNVGIRRRSETTTLNFDVGRSQQPRSDGRQITQDEVRFYLDRRVTDRLSGQFGVNGFRQSAIGDLDRFDQTSYSLDFTGSYRIERDWTVQATYTFQSSNTDAFGQPGQTQAVDQNIDQSNRRLLISVIYRGIGYRR